MVSTSNLPSSSVTNTTTDYFNNYFSEDLFTSSNIDEAVTSYFESITGNTDTAKVLGSSVLYTALSQGINPMELIDQFRKMPPGELNAYLAMLLNLNRASTSLLGISNQPETNKYIQRAILP